MNTTSRQRKRQAGLAGAIVGVGLAHVLLFSLLGLAGVPPPAPMQNFPAIDIQLVTPFRPPPEPEPSPDPGGGAPAAPSIVHVTPKPPVKPPELPAPPAPAPEQPLVVGASPKPTPSPTPGLGQGGEGNGTGTGQGSGDGPGSGSGAMILRGASNGEILGFVPPEARRQRVPGRASVNCVIRSDTRLEACRVVSETPQGLGFGDAATRIAETYFRFRPPTTASGRTVEGFRVTVFVEFGRQSR